MPTVKQAVTTTMPQTCPQCQREIRHRKRWRAFVGICAACYAARQRNRTKGTWADPTVRAHHAKMCTAHDMDPAPFPFRAIHEKLL